MRENNFITFAAKGAIFAAVFLIITSVLFAAVITPWKNQKSEHFSIYFHNPPQGYIDKLVCQAELYYKEIVDEFGFSRHDEFWTWDNRAKLYLYDSKEDYLKSTNQPLWSAASVNAFNREIYGYVDMEDFFDVILPHELAHIIFREFIGYKKKLPLWFDEGVASYMEKKNRQERLLISKVIMQQTRFMDLEMLTTMKRSTILMPEIFYAESASVIEFLLKTYSKESFVEFCRALRDLRDDQDWQIALKKVYRLKDVAELNNAWIKFLKELDFKEE